MEHKPKHLDALEMEMGQRHIVTHVVLWVSVLLAGCVSGYSQFYKSAPETTLAAINARRVAPAPATPIVERAQPDDSQRILDAYAKRGYVMIGSAQFNSGRPESEDGAVQQAQIVGADLVLILNPRYTGTVTSAIPITMPTTTTSYSTGSARAYGPAGSVTAYGSGTTTTYGTNTTYIPLTIHRSDFGAVFFVKQRFGLGLFTRDLNDSERQKLQTNSGAVVRLVVDGSPAFTADILVDDVITTLDGDSFTNARTFTDLLRERSGKVVTLSIVRRGERIAKTLQLNPSPPVARNLVDAGTQNKATFQPNSSLPVAKNWVDASTENAQQGRWAEVIRTASAAISVDPNNISAYLNRCWAYIEKGFYDNAIQDCNFALNKDPGNLAAKNNLALVLHKQGKLNEAATEYQAACFAGLEISCQNFKSIRGYSPKDVKEIVGIKTQEAASLFAKGDWRGVVRLSNEALELDSNNAMAFANRSGAKANMGDYQGALSDADAAIALNPNESLPYNNKGYALYNLNRKKEALLQYEIACGLGNSLACNNHKKASAELNRP